jgi:uncharacterized protein (TIGR02421 family)
VFRICDTAREVDRQLAAISRRLKMLFFLNPVNSDTERQRFWSRHGAYEPRFRYKPLDFDRDLVRRELYELHVEDIQDPVLQDLYRRKRWEVDNQLSLLDERGTDNLTFTSEKLFGALDEQDVRDAHAILEMDPVPEQRTLSAERVKRMLEKVVASYTRKAGEPFTCRVRMRQHLSSNAAAGERSVALKTHGRYSLNDARILGIHEVGWHVLTANNGSRQPLELFAIGLPGFLGTQEGTAIFAEYMSGTLTVNRLRIIAGRTLAVSLAAQGWKFSETFDYLMRMPHGFDRNDAFTICERAYRGGSSDAQGRWRGVYTKDAIYQRYFVRVFTYWRAGLDLRVLSAGKMDIDHVPMVARAIEEGVLVPPVFVPTFVADENNLKLRRIVMGLLTRRPVPPLGVPGFHEAGALPLEAALGPKPPSAPEKGNGKAAAEGGAVKKKKKKKKVRRAAERPAASRSSASGRDEER